MTCQLDSVHVHCRENAVSRFVKECECSGHIISPLSGPNARVNVGQNCIVEGHDISIHINMTLCRAKCEVSSKNKKSPTVSIRHN